MSASSSSSAASSAGAGGQPEDSSVLKRVLRLADGREVHYAVGGDLSSRRIFIGLHGVFGIGAISPYQSRLLAERGWMSLAPTLPGWGTSSPFPANTPISAYVSDIRQLVDAVLAIKHEAGTTPSHIIVFGGSYGSVWAYAVAANSPPTPSALRLEPSAVRGLIVMGGFSPFREHRDYGDGMGWMNYLTVGKLGLYPPFSWMHSLVGSVIRKQVANSVEGSLKLLKQILTGEKAMTPEERAQMKEWAAKYGFTFEEWELSMAQNMSQSITDTLDGYHRVSETLNADWGFRLENIRMSKPVTESSSGNSSETAATPNPLPVLRIGSEQPIPEVLPSIVLAGGLRDHLAHIEMMRWVNVHLPHSQLLELSGNHISGITSMLPIIQATIRGIELEDAAVGK